MRRVSAAASERRRKSSGTITVTNCDSPRASAQRYSMTASTRPSFAGSTSRSGRMSVSCRNRARRPGSVRLPGAWIAWKRSSAIRRAYQTRLVQRRVERLDVEDDLVRRRRGLLHGAEHRRAAAARPCGSAGASRRSRRPASGIATVTAHAPSRELRLDDDERHEQRRRGADAVDDRAPLPAAVARPAPVADHAVLRERERREDAEHVEVQQRVHVRGEDRRSAPTRGRPRG